MSTWGTPRRFSRGWVDCYCRYCKPHRRAKQINHKQVRLAEKRLWKREESA